MSVRLSVNVDHVATLRQARRAEYPDPVEAARVAEDAGAAGITVHLRADRRHVQEEDVERLAASIRGKLNLEIAPSEEMIAVALRLRPAQVTLVPERPDEVTTEGGLDVPSQGGRIEDAARRLSPAGVAVSVFLDPDPDQVEALADLAGRLAAGVRGAAVSGAAAGGAPPIAGFEINTDAYTRAAGDDERSRELERCRRAASLGRDHGLAVYAGHGLTAANVAPIAAIPEIEELNIGHWLIARAVVIGMAAAVREMLEAMAG